MNFFTQIIQKYSILYDLCNENTRNIEYLLQLNTIESLFNRIGECCSNEYSINFYILVAKRLNSIIDTELLHGICPNLDAKRYLDLIIIYFYSNDNIIISQ